MVGTRRSPASPSSNGDSTSFGDRENVDELKTRFARYKVTAAAPRREVPGKGVSIAVSFLRCRILKSIQQVGARVERGAAVGTATAAVAAAARARDDNITGMQAFRARHKQAERPATRRRKSCSEVTRRMPSMRETSRLRLQWNQVSSVVT